MKAEGGLLRGDGSQGTARGNKCGGEGQPKQSILSMPQGKLLLYIYIEKEMLDTTGYLHI